MARASIATDLAGGWRLLREDPVGVLLPAGAVLLLQAAAIAGLQWTFLRLDTLPFVAIAAAIVVGRVLLAAPFRALALAAGARQIDRAFAPWSRAPSLAGVWIVAALVETLVVGVLLASTLAPAWWLLARGTYWGPVLIVALTTLPILIIGLIVRTAFAYAAVEATAGGRAPGAALQEGLSAASQDWIGILAILLTGEVLVAAGSLLCGAGALPGTPYADLALLHRWSHRAEVP